MKSLSGIEIANNIRAERNRANLSQEHVASKLKVSTKTYISYEQNAKNLKTSDLIKLANILGCNVKVFFLQSNFAKCE